MELLQLLHQDPNHSLYHNQKFGLVLKKTITNHHLHIHQHLHQNIHHLNRKDGIFHQKLPKTEKPDEKEWMIFTTK
jgi:hypothetical protein